MPVRTTNATQRLDMMLAQAERFLVNGLRGEALEESDDPDLLRFDANTKRMDAAVARVSWERPPATSR